MHDRLGARGKLDRWPRPTYLTHMFFAKVDAWVGMSADLQKRMQGKSCFNFKKVELELFDALERLTAECATAYADPVDAKPH